MFEMGLVTVTVLLIETLVIQLTVIRFKVVFFLTQYVWLIGKNNFKHLFLFPSDHFNTGDRTCLTDSVILLIGRAQMILLKLKMLAHQ